MKRTTWRWHYRANAAGRRSISCPSRGGAHTVRHRRLAMTNEQLGRPNFISSSGLNIGRDRGSPAWYHGAPFAFTGRLLRVEVTMDVDPAPRRRWHCCCDHGTRVEDGRGMPRGPTVRLTPLLARYRGRGASRAARGPWLTSWELAASCPAKMATRPDRPLLPCC